MVSRTTALLAALALGVNATYPVANTTSSYVAVPTTTTTVDTTVYTTVCPATSTYTSGAKTYTSVYTTTSTITSCKGGCPSTFVAKPSASAPAAANCEKVRSDCQSKPEANQATCAALYAQCAGTTSGFNKPSVSTTSAPAPSSTASSCQDKFNKCRQPAPDGTSANQAVCAADFEACQSTCQDQYNKCRQPEADGIPANQAVCAAQFAGCNGFIANTTAPSGTTIETTVYTTVCPATSTYTSGTQVKTTVYTTTSTITSCKGGCSSTYAPAPTSSISFCDDQYNKCRQPATDGSSANQAVCAAQFAACKSSSSSSSTATSIHPSAPVATNPASSAPAPSSTTISACQDQYNKCRQPAADGTSANQAVCAAQFAACKNVASSTMATATTPVQQTYPVGTGSMTATSTGVQYTGAAVAVKPVGGLMAIIGAAFVLV